MVRATGDGTAVASEQLRLGWELAGPGPADELRLGDRGREGCLREYFCNWYISSCCFNKGGVWKCW